MTCPTPKFVKASSNSWEFRKPCQAQSQASPSSPHIATLTLGARAYIRCHAESGHTRPYSEVDVAVIILAAEGHGSQPMLW